MLMEADLPDDVDALRALVLEQARALADLSDAKSKADARIERLQAITDDDARAEGVADREAFRVLWTSVYGQESWSSNPFVWVVKFKKEKP